MKKGNIIGAFIFVIVLAVTILVYMVSVSSDESSENMPANVPAVVKPETKAQDKAVVDVYWDATSSMAGYATISNGNLYKNLPDNLEDVASSLGEVHFFKFGKEITVIDQGFSGAGRSYWCESIMHAESMYLELLNAGATPQLARSVLPTCVKAEIVVTANVEEWLHIFELRSCGFTGSPHPMMKELMDKLLSDVINDWYIKYNDNMNRLLIGGDWLYE